MIITGKVRYLIHILDKINYFLMISRYILIIHLHYPHLPHLPSYYYLMYKIIFVYFHFQGLFDWLVRTFTMPLHDGSFELAYLLYNKYK